MNIKTCAQEKNINKNVERHKCGKAPSGADPRLHSCVSNGTLGFLSTRTKGGQGELGPVASGRLSILQQNQHYYPPPFAQAPPACPSLARADADVWEPECHDLSQDLDVPLSAPASSLQRLLACSPETPSVLSSPAVLCSLQSTGEMFPRAVCTPSGIHVHRAPVATPSADKR